jgi:hypothetical protein
LDFEGNAGGKEFLAWKDPDLGYSLRRYDSSSTIARYTQDLPRPLRITSLVGYERYLSNRYASNGK